MKKLMALGLLALLFPLLPASAAAIPVECINLSGLYDIHDQAGSTGDTVEFLQKDCSEFSWVYTLYDGTKINRKFITDGIPREEDTPAHVSATIAMIDAQQFRYIQLNVQNSDLVATRADTFRRQDDTTVIQYTNWYAKTGVPSYPEPGIIMNRFTKR